MAHLGARYRVAATNGGTADNPDPLKNNAWWQFATISNELNSPQVLVCPADRNVGAPRKVADNWGTMETNEGFLAPGFRHLATSYTIGLDSRPQLTGDIERQDPGLVLGTDRNIQFDRSNLACSSGLLGSQAVKVRGKNNQNLPATATWTNAIHGLRGNVLAVDCSVQQANATELYRLFDLNDDTGGIHFLVPK